MVREIKWNYEIGQIIKDKKRDLVIIDRKFRKNKNNINKKW